MVENISSLISTKVWDQARIKLMASGSTIRLTTDCPSGPGKTCISCTRRFERCFKVFSIKSI